MDALLYILVRSLVSLLQSLPLILVARLGRSGGGLAYWLDARHRHVAQRNLTMCFGEEKSAAEIRALAREIFGRIGESYACGIKPAGMTLKQLRPHVEFVAPALLSPPLPAPQSVVAAIGH